MTKTDSFMYHTILNILADGYTDINPRPKYADGTPAHTWSINHTCRTYDLSYEFPICSLRPIAWKTGIKEIFTIYQKPTNEITKMEEMGVKWWGDWDIGDGTIGQRYGATVARYNLINNLNNSETNFKIQKNASKNTGYIELNQKIGEEDIIDAKYYISDSTKYYFVKGIVDTYINDGGCNYFESINTNTTEKDNINYLYNTIIRSIKNNLKEKEVFVSPISANLAAPHTILPASIETIKFM